ncbi:hypothetical protein QQ008_09595 [Fulvivirgaceae bacterium BMA10]|uniref:Uncharacterized protein n=1 Tax=Splendidivirga corallicola TaxID=3051826 RepID=A0ABT8KLL4_9BACT|nr:hypothetical protein [Fulvivirgaceae bacterium BMA10]
MVKTTRNSLIIEGNGKIYEISCNVRIVNPLDSRKSKTIKAIWDTGATDTCINEKIVNLIGLISAGKIEVINTSHKKLVEVYPVELHLPNGLWCALTCAASIQKEIDCDMLIGMDVITQGDFCITNENGNTIVSFTIPHRNKIDFCE